jgi:hypothetical protein
MIYYGLEPVILRSVLTKEVDEIGLIIVATPKSQNLYSTLDEFEGST